MESNSETTTFTDSVVFEVIKEFGERAEKGYEKYGTDMDRTDLSVADWAQHLREELMDGLVYLTRLRKDILLLEEELRAFKTQQMIRNKLAEGSIKDSALTTTSGTKVVYTMAQSKPNKVYTDEEPTIRKKYNWHR
jgi:hypothetical protein